MLINLGKGWNFKLFPNPVRSLSKRCLNRNTFWRPSFYSTHEVSPGEKSLSTCRNPYSNWCDSMEDDLRTDTPCRISYLRQRRSGVDKRCQSWPVRTYKILVYRPELFKINFTGHCWARVIFPIQNLLHLYDPTHLKFPKWHTCSIVYETSLVSWLTEAINENYCHVPFSQYQSRLFCGQNFDFLFYQEAKQS